MKYRYDKTKREVVPKPEPESPLFDLLPVPPELKEQLEVLQAMRDTMNKVLFGRS